MKFISALVAIAMMAAACSSQQPTPEHTDVANPTPITHGGSGGGDGGDGGDDALP